MITEELINDQNFRPLCTENKRLRFWFYILFGILTIIESNFRIYKEWLHLGTENEALRGKLGEVHEKGLD